MTLDCSKSSNHYLYRLEHGLEKLRVTAVEVSELKKILAVQEIELAEKNEIADNLIRNVGIETAKVTLEKEAGKRKDL